MKHNRYSVEFTMHIFNTPLETLKNCLLDLGHDLHLDEEKGLGAEGKILKIHINTDDPQLVFDTCSEFGRLKSVKINETND